MQYTYWCKGVFKMSYIDLILLGFIVNAVLYVLSIVFGLIIGFINLGMASPDYIFRIQKSKVAMAELKEKMTPEDLRNEKLRTMAPLAFPFGMLIPAFRIINDAIYTRFDLVDMSYISMQRLKDRYKI